MMNHTISIIGAGYVGLVSGVCLADMGNTVICHDIDSSKIAKLKEGKVPFYEPDLDGLLKKNLHAKRLFFTDTIKGIVKSTSLIFICVGTPPKKSGAADMRAYFSVMNALASELKTYSCSDRTIVINKSTVPIGTASYVSQMMSNKAPGSKVSVVSNPEFLREGKAVSDFMNPDRIVIGIQNNAHRRVKQTLLKLYKPFSCKKLIVNTETAELIKYASNAFLATKISFINEIANVCERVGANVSKVAEGMGYDQRIGRQFLRAGIGYGGSCFPKDVRALQYISFDKNYSFKLLRAVIEVNNQQRMHAIEKITGALCGAVRNKKICVFGLAFKPHTDDIRESAGIFIIKELLKKGSLIRAYDPEALKNAKKEIGAHKNIIFFTNAYSAAKKADLIFCATDWPEFITLDYKQILQNMNGNILIDGRNALDANALARVGFVYKGFGISQ